MRIVVVYVALCMLFASVFATPVSTNGQLSVNKSSKKLVNKDGKSIILRGMSLFWNNYDNAYWNANVVKNMAKNWNMNLVRAAMGAGSIENGNKKYYYDGDNDIKEVSKIVDAAIDAGIYVIIDWHGHYAKEHKADAKSFFSAMAKKYKSYPNVIYEVWNEPLGTDSWKNDIKPYAEDVIKAIREHDSDNIIIVGTGNWCQRLDEVVGNEINDDNVMYSVHIYANSHWNPSNQYSSWTKSVIKAGFGKVPMFMSEWGTCDADGNGTFSKKYSDEVLAAIEGEGISWCNWSLNNKAEQASAIKSSVSKTDGSWVSSDLTASGSYIFSMLKSKNAAYNSSGSGSGNKGESPVITASGVTINVGESYTVTATATDAEDGNLTSKISKSGSVNNNVAGTYKLTFTVIDSDGNKTTKIVDVVVEVKDEAMKFVVLDDFENRKEDGNNQTHLGAQFNYYFSEVDNYSGAGYWYIFDDSKEGVPGTSSANPNYKSDNEFAKLETSDVHGGKQALKLDINLGSPVDEYNTAFYGVGCNLTAENNYSDLSKMSALTFWAKGSGKFKVVFVTKYADNLDDWGNYEAGFELTSKWTQYTISDSDFKPSEYSKLAESGKSFKGFADKEVKSFQIQTNGLAGEELSIVVDDIRVEGMEYGDFEWGKYTVGNKTPVSILAFEPEDQMGGDLLKVAPMPVKSDSKVMCQVAKAGEYTLKLYSINEVLLGKTQFYATRGKNSIDWDVVNKLSGGVYYLVLQDGREIVAVTRIVKIK